MQSIKTVTFNRKAVPFRFSARIPSTPQEPEQLLALVQAMVDEAAKRKVFDYSMCDIREIELYLSDWALPVLYVWTENIRDRKAYYAQRGYAAHCFVFSATHCTSVEFDVNIKEF